MRNKQHRLLCCSAKSGFIWADLNNFVTGVVGNRHLYSLRNKVMVCGANTAASSLKSGTIPVSGVTEAFVPGEESPSCPECDTRFCRSAQRKSCGCRKPLLPADTNPSFHRGLWKSDSPSGTLGEWEPHNDTWLCFLTKCGSLGMPGYTRAAPSTELGSLVAHAEPHSARTLEGHPKIWSS